jgi:hypothetical protein
LSNLTGFDYVTSVFPTKKATKVHPNRGAWTFVASLYLFLKFGSDASGFSRSYKKIYLPKFSLSVNIFRAVFLFFHVIFQNH